jgi:hypothetical protein
MAILKTEKIMDKRIIFIHGLGGDINTWGSISAFITDIAEIETTCNFLEIKPWIVHSASFNISKSLRRS